MKKIVVHGGRPLEGLAQIHGAKNSVLPILAACVLNRSQCILKNCPAISDVDTAVAILEHLGAKVEREGATISVEARQITRCSIPRHLMEDMRSSVLFMGALLGRCGAVELTAPGGCALGERPVDFHLYAMEQMGVLCTDDGDCIRCVSPLLKSCTIHLPLPSVGATENAILAATGCMGCVTIENAAKEPEILDLANFLRAMGGDVRGAGTDTIVIQGKQTLHTLVYTVMADRIETITYLSAVALCQGDVFLEGGRLDTLLPVADALVESGCQLFQERRGVRIRAIGRRVPPQPIVTAPYPGFPTDGQPLLMAAMLKSVGTTEITETIFCQRMCQVEPFTSMGVDIRCYGQRALVRGVAKLHGATMEATDLRCGAALVVASLGAEGQSTITNVHYIQRGYQDLVPQLHDLGVDITIYN
ncbi:MAG: UDP-N-acetylglucosamine 1-carboxyvinyltransferase [Eubacteriales bacterium]